VDRVLSDPLEEVYDEADCLVNTTWASTTHGFAVMTRKPHVLVDTQGALWPDEQFAVMKARSYHVRTASESNMYAPVEEDLNVAAEELSDRNRVREKLEASHMRIAGMVN